MTETLKEILASIRAECGDLPEQSVRRALEFYEEYFADALEAGHSEQETLERLGGVKEIVAQVRAEAAVSGAERRPGPFRLIGAGRQVLRGPARSAARASMILGASIPYTLALGVYLIASAVFVAAPATAALMGYGITTMPRADAMAKIGTAAVGLSAAAISTAVGLGLWAAARGITRVTLRVLRRGMRHDGLADPQRQKAPHAHGMRAALVSCAVVALVGLGGAFVSGLPMKLFSIWNSMKPVNLEVRTWRFRPGEIRSINVSTLNSGILLEADGDSREGISVSYEEPEWLTGTPVVRNRDLVFREASSGTLPFMDMIAMHTGTTSVRITVPLGYRADAVALESGSGDVSFALSAGTVRVATNSGDISFSEGGNLYRIRASTPRGKIIVRGKPIVEKTYSEGPVRGAAAELTTEDGTLEIRS